MVSPEFLQDNECLAFFDHTAAQQYRQFIFVRYRDVADKWAARHEALRAAYKVGRKVRWPEPDERRQETKKKRFYKQLRYWLVMTVPRRNSFQAVEDGCYQDAEANRQSMRSCLDSERMDEVEETNGNPGTRVVNGPELGPGTIELTAEEAECNGRVPLLCDGSYENFGPDPLTAGTAPTESVPLAHGEEHTCGDVTDAKTAL